MAEAGGLCSPTDTRPDPFRNGEGRYLPVGGAYPAAKPGSPPGEPMYASQSFFNVDKPVYLRPGDSQLLTTAANFDGLIVPEPDTHHFAVLIDGREINQALQGHR